jgi:hypothetical protein
MQAPGTPVARAKAKRVNARLRHFPGDHAIMSTMPRSPEENIEPDPDKLLDPDAPPNTEDPDMPDGPDSATPMVPADPHNGEPRM